MTLLEVHLKAFGCLVERRFEFRPKMNVIAGPNEAGKTTLQQAIVALLYGFYDGQRVSRRERKLHERFRPWRSDVYAGSLKYKLDDGSVLIVSRDFSKDDIPTHLLDGLTGEELADRYSRGRHGKIDFIEKQMGMSRPIFLATACVRHGALQMMKSSEASRISDTILRLLDSAATETSAERAIERLEKAMGEIGSDRSQKAMLAQARHRLKDLYESRELRLATQRAIQEDLEQAESLDLELDELNVQVSSLERQQLEIQLDLLRHRLERWQKNQERQRQISEEIDQLAAMADFPAEKKEEFFRLRDEYLSFDKHRTVLANERNSLERRQMALAEDSKSVHVPDQLWEARSFEDFLALRQRWQITFDEIVENEGKKYEADGALKAAGLDETDRAMLAGLESQRLESYTEMEEMLKAAEREVETVRKDYDESHRRAVQRRRWLNLGAIVAVVSLIYALSSLATREAGASIFWPIVLSLLSLAGLALAVIYHVRWTARERELGLRLVEAEDHFMEDRHELREILRHYHVASIQELVQRRLQYVELGTVEQRHYQLANELQKIEKGLEPWMASLGIGHVAPETLQEAEARLRESHEHWSERRSIEYRLEEIQAQQSKISDSLTEVASQLEQILKQAGIDEPVGDEAFQAFLTGCQRREYLESLRMQQQQAKALSREILENQTSESLQAKIAELESKLAGLPRPAGEYRRLEVEATKGALAALRERHASALQEIHEHQQQLAAIRERIATRELGLPPVAEIEEDIALVEDEVARFERARQALEIACDTIAQAAQRMHRDFVPRLNDFLGRHLATLTRGKYRGALIDPAGFAVRVIEDNNAAPMDLEQLSQGTREQAYLLLRAAVVELFTKTGESIPLFLDDPLVHADDDRRKNALAILETLADTHQIFYFTKDKLLSDYFSERYGPEAIIELK